MVNITFAARAVRLVPCYRIVASRMPTIHLFDRVADPSDWDALYELESLTNPRIRNEVGELNQGTRFTDGHFGAYYAAESIDTSIAETRYHRENFLRATSQPPIELEMRCYLADVACDLHDLRGRRAELPEIYDPVSYNASQRLGASLRAAGSNGIAFDSVRRPGGECVAVFRPRLVQNVRQGVHLRYAWDGQSISQVYEIRAMNL
jgi:hypothetical protein